MTNVRVLQGLVVMFATGMAITFPDPLSIVLLAVFVFLFLTFWIGRAQSEFRTVLRICTYSGCILFSLNAFIGLGRIVSSPFDASDGVFQLSLGTIVLTMLLPFVYDSGHDEPQKKHGSRFCKMCGYDLRATPDRCPECGHVTSSTLHSEPE